MKQDIPLPTKRLSKTLAAAGVASRRACEELIFSGRVLVNGKKVTSPQILVDWKKDVILLDGKQIRGEEEKVYFLLHKPVGYLCTAKIKKGGAKRVLDLFGHLPHRLFTVGRLDQDTAGLILVTNDGHFGNQLIHPSNQIAKEYLIKTNQEITDQHLKQLSAGLYVEKTFVKPISVTKVRRGTLKIVIAEGKKHEVRQLASAASLTIKELTRIRIGPFMLGNLFPGNYRPLSPQEIAFILDPSEKDSVD